MEQRKILVESDFLVEHIDVEREAPVSYDERGVPFDLLVNVPLNMAADFVERSGLGDELNYVPVDEHTLQSMAFANASAVGDASEDLGKALPAAIGITLADGHWDAIRFVRDDFAEQGETATQMPQGLGGLPGMTAMATSKLRKSIADLAAPEVPGFLDQIVASGGHVWACRMPADMNRLTNDDLYDEVEAIISASDVVEKTAGAQLLFR